MMKTAQEKITTQNALRQKLGLPLVDDPTAPATEFYWLSDSIVAVNTALGTEHYRVSDDGTFTRI